MNAFWVSVGKTTFSFYVKGCNFRLSVSPGSAEALVGWGGKIKYHLIAYFHSNISAKNYQNRSMFVEVIASESSVVFWDTVLLFKQYPTLHAKQLVILKTCAVAGETLDVILRLGILPDAQNKSLSVSDAASTDTCHKLWSDFDPAHSACVSNNFSESRYIWTRFLWPPKAAPLYLIAVMYFFTSST